MGAEGSVTVIGAVSPPGGDFSEPVTQGTLRVIKTFWALDAKLAQRRHFPSINWLTSYSLYLESLAGWYGENVAPDWMEHIGRTRSILQEEEKLVEIMQLVGSDALPEREQVTLLVARMFRESLLQQNAYHPVDTYSELRKTYLIMKTILHFADLAKAALDSGTRAQRIVVMKSKDGVAMVKFEKDYETFLNCANKDMEKEFAALK
jgi:V/A-type H+-transporting ATPase subunit A